MSLTAELGKNIQQQIFVELIRKIKFQFLVWKVIVQQRGFPDTCRKKLLRCAVSQAIKSLTKYVKWKSGIANRYSLKHWKIHLLCRMSNYVCILYNITKTKLRSSEIHVAKILKIEEFQYEIPLTKYKTLNIVLLTIFLLLIPQIFCFLWFL